MSKCELIELQDLSLNDPIELAAPAGRTGPPPVTAGQAFSFHGGGVGIGAPRCRTGVPGSGHDFQPHGQAHLSWCDLCGEFIWGLYKQSLRCTNCSYTCHHRCRPFIQLSCTVDGGLLEDEADLSADAIETDTNVDEPINVGGRELSAAVIHQKVKDYNAQINSNLHMTVNKDGFYTGFIKVHFQLARPITLPPRSLGPTAPEDDRQGRRVRRRTSFYLPKDTAKHLHVSSRTRAQEVIQALLNKFTVVDNPAKFALFKRAERQSQGRGLS